MLPRIVDKEFTLSDAGCAEGVRLDDVRPCFQKSAVDVTDHLWLRQGEKVTVVQQALRRVLEPLSADVRFRHAIGADCSAHRSVDDGNSTLENLFKWMLIGSRHFFLLAFSVPDFGNVPAKPRRLAEIHSFSSTACFGPTLLLSHFCTEGRLFYYSDWRAHLWRV